MATSKDVELTMLKQLKNPFDPRFVKWRVGATNADKTKGIALAYIDSREVKKRFDEVMGLAGWRDRLIPVPDGFISEIDLKINDEWVTRSNAAGNTKVEPIKGGASDAFKRAASKWGVGHYLYYLPNVWVEIRQQGKSYVLAEIPELPEWAKPGEVENWEDVAELAADSTSGEDGDQQFADMIITNMDSIRGVETEEGLDEVLKSIPQDEQLIMANEIAAKRRSLKHDDKINTNNR